MPSKRPSKGIHTSPDKSGRQNLEGMLDTLPKDDDGIMKKIFPVWIRGKQSQKEYKGLWTEEEMARNIGEFFAYCHDVELKPTKPLLQIWLGVTDYTFNYWLADEHKYGFKTRLAREAVQIMEAYLQANIDKYPTGSMFLLKTVHGHVEKSQVNVVSQNQVDPDQIGNLISQLGLDRPKEPAELEGDEKLSLDAPKKKEPEGEIIDI